MEIGTTLRVDPIPTRTTTAAIPPVSTLFWSIRGLDNGAKHTQPMLHVQRFNNVAELSELLARLIAETAPLRFLVS